MIKWFFLIIAGLFEVGWAIGLKTLRRTPLRSIARMTPRLTLVRPTLVPVGISIIIRDTVYPLSLPPVGRVTKQHRQLSWRCDIRQSDGSRLAR